MKLRSIFALWGLSLALHAGLAFAVFSIPKDQKRAATAITMHEAKKTKPTEAAKVDEPPPPPKEQKTEKSHKASAQPEAKAKPVAAAQAASPVSGGGDVPDFGLSMSGSSGGLAIPAGNSGVGDAAPHDDAPKRAMQAQAAKHVDCDEPLVKAKPHGTVQPAYTERAREAKVEGKVRVEVTLDESGTVVSARVLAGLGYGLDEAALAAARRMSFGPATKCGKPSASSFVVAMRFVLGT